MCARCDSCNACFVQKKGDICRKCSGKLEIGEISKETESRVVCKAEPNATTKEENEIMQSLNDIENVEIVEEDEDGINKTIFHIPLIEIDDDDVSIDTADYYVSIDDINDMLNEESANI